MTLKLSTILATCYELINRVEILKGKIRMSEHGYGSESASGYNMRMTDDMNDAMRLGQSDRKRIDD